MTSEVEREVKVDIVGRLATMAFTSYDAPNVGLDAETAETIVDILKTADAGPAPIRYGRFLVGWALQHLHATHIAEGSAILVEYLEGMGEDDSASEGEEAQELEQGTEEAEDEEEEHLLDFGYDVEEDLLDSSDLIPLAC
jgi:hypothetical protein